MYSVEDEEYRKISRSGLLARSPEGHAAKGMPIKGHEDMWVEIQAHTFRNWVNENLRDCGYQVNDLSTDLCDGVRLVALVSSLQKKRLKYVKRPLNQHQSLENVTTALNAITDDGIKLVNIGSVDIVNGNLKLILGLIWSLIVHYQFGSSKFPPKKMMLAWLKNVLPECSIHNFTSDWNSGIALSALLDYCKPGLFPDWRELDPRESVQNCERAMRLAQKVFNIPMVLEPEYLASPYLDELSGMTYLSYFMKELSPGYFATLRWVQSQVPECNVKNFTTDWNDGLTLCTLVRSFGGPVPGHKNLSRRPEDWETNQEQGVNGGLRLGVEPVLRPVDMADPEVEHLGVMAYAAGFQWLKKKPPPGERLVVNIDTKKARVNQPSNFRLEFIYPEDIDPSLIRVEIIGPNGPVPCDLELGPDGGIGTFIPTDVGMHELIVYNEDEPVKGCPYHIRAAPDRAEKIMFSGLDPCSVGSVVEVSINSNGAADSILQVVAEAPSGRELHCPVDRDGNAFITTFKPDEAGQWSIAIYYDDEHIQGSPFSCVVYDPHAVKLSGLEGAVPQESFTFTCDAIAAGIGEVRFDVVHRGKSIPHQKIEIKPGIYRVTFVPPELGKYRIYTYFNGSEVKGSPFKMMVTPDGKPVPENQKKNSRRDKSPEKLEKKTSYSPLNASFREEGKENRFNSIDRINKRPPGSPEINGHEDFSHLQIAQSPRGVSSIQNFELLKSVKEVNRVNKALISNRDETDAVHSRIVSRRDVNVEERGPNLAAVSVRDVNVEGRGLDLAAMGQTSSFTVESQDIRADDLTVVINGPKGTTIKPRVFDGPKSHSVTVEFSTTHIGEYIIDVLLLGQPLPNSPFRCFAYNSQEIRVGNIPDGVVGEPVEFEIDGSSAGSGNLEILVNGGHVTSSVSSLGGQKFLASFVPHQASLHTIEMKFNDDPVPGSPWTIMVVEQSVTPGKRPSVIGDGVRHIPARRQAAVQLALASYQTVSDVKATVLGPNKRTVPHNLVNLYNGTCEVEFTPTEVGAYVVDAAIGSMKVYGCPMIAKAYDASLIRVSEVTSGRVGQVCQFRVDAGSAGEGQLEISINDGEVPNQVQVLGGGRCLVSFTPDHPRLHTIDIKFNGETVPGCPFKCKILDTSRVSVSLKSLELIPLGEPAQFNISVDSNSNAELAVAVRGPTTDPPVRVTGNTQNGLVAEFTPSEVGPHTVTVELNGISVPGTPAVCKAYDSRKVVVSQVPRGIIGKQVQFTVDAGGCGEGNLEITISARGRNVPTQVQPQGSAKFIVSFVPLEAVDHVVSITFNKEPVPGSPFTCTISNDPGRVTATGRALTAASILRTSTFQLTNISGSVDDIEVNIEGVPRNL
ncbi:hypothetical protein QYM36_005214 [Artemia franciscana]|uniref:Calponin-homology (CH) domain-containing protein n=1 Tax=Artemia franciscana TaxID=6661 RepID=A0AA88LFH9_ARTSF|nr:hypothetical protein QYM36_005214 [Artemia franciscana]KAK2719656.1 hypothetical protein QYM36_005214 [Artemia franciscana]